MKILLILILFFSPFTQQKQISTTLNKDSITLDLKITHRIESDTIKVHGIIPIQPKEQKSQEKNVSGYLRLKWIELIGLLIAILAFFVPIYRYIGQKREEQRDKRFVTYHKLIKHLVQGDGAKPLMLDRQIAIAFELRKFPKYYELTERILEDLKVQWSDDPRNERISKEINLTIAYIHKEKKWYNQFLRFLKLKK